MPRHTTQNPEQRAVHILQREEDERYRRSGSFEDPEVTLEKLYRYSDELKGYQPESFSQ